MPRRHDVESRTGATTPWTAATAPPSDGMICDGDAGTLPVRGEDRGCDAEVSPCPTAQDGARSSGRVQQAGCSSSGAQLVSCAYDGGHVRGRGGDHHVAVDAMWRFFEGPREQGQPGPRRPGQGRHRATRGGAPQVAYQPGDTREASPASPPDGTICAT